jgi:uncharacterized protein YbbC (DUF1343 family)
MIKLYFLYSAALLFISSANCQITTKNDFQFGADRLVLEEFNLIKNKNVGIVTNHTATLSDGTHLVDAVKEIKGVRVTALFGPEHGIRGDNSAGNMIADSIDFKTGIPVYSLYGKDRKPTKEMLENVEVLIFDIQDIGARFYTYISTLFYTIQAAAENNIPMIVLDRPNPINGIYVDGPIRKPDLKSFVGIAPLPITHGMTAGELANYFTGERLIGENFKVNLQIVKMKNWNRSLFYDSYHSAWIKPSPNISSLETAIVYPGTCLVEGTNISEGRGTAEPFLQIGVPFINSSELVNELLQQKIPGIHLDTISFTPKEIEGVATNPKYKDETCYGIKFKVINREKFESVKFGIQLIAAIHKLYPNEFKFRNDSFDKLSGDRTIRLKIEEGMSLQKIVDSYQVELQQFNTIRKKYLLY